MNDDSTTIDEVLAGLPSETPDAARAQRVRSRCHAKLSRSGSLPRRSRDCKERLAKAGAFEPAVVGGFCAVYLTVLALLALRTRGLL